MNNTELSDRYSLRSKTKANPVPETVDLDNRHFKSGDYKKRVVASVPAKVYRHSYFINIVPFLCQ